jgi:hypothetical protein
MEKGDQSTQKKFEFDLFSLPDDKFKKLEKYVEECINMNKGKDKEYTNDRKTQSAFPEKNPFD